MVRSRGGVSRGSSVILPQAPPFSAWGTTPHRRAAQIPEEGQVQGGEPVPGTHQLHQRLRESRIRPRIATFQVRPRVTRERVTARPKARALQIGGRVTGTIETIVGGPIPLPRGGDGRITNTDGEQRLLEMITMEPLIETLMMRKNVNQESLTKVL